MFYFRRKLNCNKFQKYIETSENSKIVLTFENSRNLINATKKKKKLWKRRKIPIIRKFVKICKIKNNSSIIIENSGNLRIF